MGWFDSVGDFFKKAAGTASNFFNKNIASPIGGLFNKAASTVAPIISRVAPIFRTVGDIGGRIANGVKSVVGNPLVTGAVSLLQPELAPALMGLNAAANAGSAGSDILSSVGRGDVGNALEKAAPLVAAAGPKFI